MTYISSRKYHHNRLGTTEAKRAIPGMFINVRGRELVSFIQSSYFYEAFMHWGPELVVRSVDLSTTKLGGDGHFTRRSLLEKLNHHWRANTDPF
jgi:hypothetical protein